MTAADIPFGMRLKTEAGWNQTEADWRRFLALSQGGTLVAERGGAAVGTVATFLFGTIGWIAMLLVDKRWRHQGIGTSLLEQGRRASPARLLLRVFRRNADARAFYERHGFRPLDENDGSRNEENEPDMTYGWTPTR